MNYFTYLGVSFGLLAMLKPFYMHILPWDEYKYIGKAYSEKRPPWVVIAGIIGLLLVGFTWYKELTTEVRYSIVISLIFSLTLIKALMLIFNYKKFQEWITGMLKKDKTKKIVLIDIAAGVVGLAMVISSILVYGNQ